MAELLERLEELEALGGRSTTLNQSALEDEKAALFDKLQEVAGCVSLAVYRNGDTIDVVSLATP